MADKVIQTNYSQNRRAQRQHNLEEVAKIAQPVDLGRIEELFGDRGFEEGTGHDHVVYGNRTRQDEHPHAVVDAEALVQKVVRNQAAGDEHGHGEQEHDHASRLELATG